MKVNSKIIKMFQDGGAMQEAPEQEPAQAAPAQGGNEAIQEVAAQLLQMLMQQVGDPQAVAAILQAALEMVAGAAQEAQPTFQRKGGRLVRK